MAVKLKDKPTKGKTEAEEPKKGKVKTKPKLAAEAGELLVSVLVDESGSMQPHLATTVSALNEYLDTLQREAKGGVWVTLIKFDSNGMRPLAENQAIYACPRLSATNYRPDGMTPLVDAAMDIIGRTERALEQHKPGKPNVLVILQSDGAENCSRRHKRSELAAMVGAKRRAGWQFVFLGAGFDAYGEAESFGVQTANTVSYGHASARSTFKMSAMKSASFGASGDAMAMNYSDGEVEGLGDTFRAQKPKR